MNTTNITSAAAAVATETQALTWVSKAGKTATAEGHVAQAQAPRAVRVGVAHALAVTQLGNNQYRPALRDAVQSLSPAALKGLQAHVAKGLSTEVDGVLMAPSGDVLVANKRVMRLVGEWACAPTMTAPVKGQKGVVATVPAKLTKNALERLAPIVEWYAETARLFISNVAQAEAEADTGATIAEVASALAEVEAALAAACLQPA